MEYYVYLIIVLCVVVKLGIYLCWYQSRKQRMSESATQVRVVMPDGSIRVMMVRGNLARRTAGLSQHTPVTGDTIYQYDNPVITVDGCVTQATTRNSESTEVIGRLPSPPSYPGQLHSKQNSPELPPSYADIFTQGNTNDNTSAHDPSSPAIMSMEPDAGITIGFEAAEDSSLPSPPPYSATDTAVPTTGNPQTPETVLNITSTGQSNVSMDTNTNTQTVSSPVLSSENSNANTT